MEILRFSRITHFVRASYYKIRNGWGSIDVCSQGPEVHALLTLKMKALRSIETPVQTLPPSPPPTYEISSYGIAGLTKFSKKYRSFEMITSLNRDDILLSVMKLQ